MSGIMSVSGLASGLQTDSILAQLEQISRAPITRLQEKKSTLQSQKSAWEGVNTRLLGIRDKATLLSKLADQVTMAATVSDGTATNNSLTVSTNAAAVAGNYSFTVDSVASYHQMSSKAFADTDTTPVGTGNLVLTLGEETATIDLAGKTLNDLRDAINEAGIGANASIVSQGSTYRLFINSQTLGTAGAVSTTGSDQTALDAVALFTLQEGEDSVLTFGSGDDAFQVTRASKNLTDVIAGVNINLTASAVGKSVTLNVTPKYDSATSIVQEFVNQYNAFVDLFNIVNKYDSESEETGTLFGDYRLRSIYSDLASMVTGSITSVTGEYNSLAQIGITVSKKGTGRLEIDQVMLEKAVSEHLTDVAGLFSMATSTTREDVTYVSVTHETRSSSGDGYDIALTQVATKTTMSLGGELPDALGQAETITLNNISIDLTQDMTPAQILDAINAKSSRTRLTASLTGANAKNLTFTAMDYGSDSHVRLISDTAGNTLNSTGIGTEQITDDSPGTGNTADIGDDVAGTINGEAATGKGRYLTGSEGAVRGLQLLIASDVLGDGNFGKVSVTRGLGSLLESKLNFITDVTNGTIATTEDGLQTSMDKIDEEITGIDESVQREQARLRAQFNAMEVALSKLQNQSSQLMAQLNQLSANSYSSSDK